MKRARKSDAIGQSIENAKSKNVANGLKASEKVAEVKGSTLEYCRMV